eukprot:scaffold100_cov357-Prasinococcus_capsulatus_cf.AAC.20
MFAHRGPHIALPAYPRALQILVQVVLELFAAVVLGALLPPILDEGPRAQREAGRVRVAPEPALVQH